MSSVPPVTPSHPRLWEQKNPWIAGILAYLIPGAGHLYQGRTTKGILYCVSILGLFFWGQKMGEGMVVYNLPETGAVLKVVSLSFAAQFGAGAAALPAILQNQRAQQKQNRANTLPAPATFAFEGTLNPVQEGQSNRLVGKIELTPVETAFSTDVEGQFEGTLDGEPTTLKLGNRFAFDPAVQAGSRRSLICGVVDPNTTHRWIAGTVPRPWQNAYAAPPSNDQLQRIGGRLGKIYELALVFTWVAGLLNVLAIWDCVLGPAYGFGDEPQPSRQADSTRTATGEPVATPAPALPVEASRADSQGNQKSPT